ncbi:hypothetical protein [Algibacillus agarilyticus]|uniref:hypothetical protein n=1 Tax=Algibacillus agarilyticus TaxID=2234133 RepID=UPI00130028A2|nr:hypothetical protein [Algibacillus agarilyticus]
MTVPHEHFRNDDGHCIIVHDIPFPAIGSILVALLMRGYTLDSAKLKQIQADLKLQEHPALKLKQ